MKVTVVRGGGLAGMVSERSADSAALNDEDAALLRRLAISVQTSAAAGLQPPAGPGATYPDEYAYEVSIEDDDGTTHRLRLTDMNATDAVRELIDLVRTVGGR